MKTCKKLVVFFLAAVMLMTSVTVVPIADIMPELSETLTEQSELPAETAAVQSITSGGVYRIKQAYFDKYITVNPNSSGNYDANLNNISAQPANGQSNQEFRIVYDSSAGIYYIKTIKSSNGNYRLLDVHSTSLSQITDNANIHLYAPGDVNSSQWRIEYVDAVS